MLHDEYKGQKQSVSLCLLKDICEVLTLTLTGNEASVGIQAG